MVSGKVLVNAGCVSLLWLSGTLFAVLCCQMYFFNSLGSGDVEVTCTFGEEGTLVYSVPSATCWTP